MEACKQQGEVAEERAVDDVHPDQEPPILKDSLLDCENPLKTILELVGAAALAGNKECQELMSHDWPTMVVAVKATLVTIVALELHKKTGGLVCASAQEIIELSESGGFDEQLWAVFPKTMAFLTEQREEENVPG